LGSDLTKKNKKGVLLPPAVGYSLRVLAYLLSRYRVDLRYLPRLLVILLINLVNLPFRAYERLVYNRGFRNKPLAEDPVFIIGHWRSGTTHLHNLLCRDRSMAYTTTYQSVFPDTLLARTGRWLFEGFARLLIPGTRKGDNVVLGTDLPQEEEFALDDKTPLCFYYFWMFPRHIPSFYDAFIRFEGITEKRRRSWEEDYLLLMKKAIRNTGKSRFLSKNPPNTARVRQLLELFPGARFIYIHRNPVEVFLSTRNFYKKMMPHLQLQRPDPVTLEEDIVEVYRRLMADYLAQREAIPPGQLVEVSYEALEQEPLAVAERIYRELGLKGFEEAAPDFKVYIEKMKSYKKNRHKLSREELERIVKAWGFAMDEWAYAPPENLEISDGN